MKNTKKFTKFIRIFTLMIVTLSFLPWQTPGFNFVKPVGAAAVNLITDGNFNQDINKSWFLWTGESSSKKYVLARSYDAPFGFGPYSMSINATGQGSSMYDGGISSIDLNRFTVTEGKNYNLSFYVKASTATKMGLHLENAETYKSVTTEKEIDISTTWVKQQITITPTASGLSSLVIGAGSLPDGTTLYLDNINLFENDATLTTTKVSGFIGDKNKSVVIANGNLFSLDELKIELPYINPQTGVVGTKQFSPISKNNSTIVFEAAEQTFSGIGKVYAGSTLIGQFDYQISVKIKEVNPNPVLVDEDLVIYGTGFNPDKDKNFVLLKAVDSKGKSYEKWVKPYMVDNQLSQLVVKLPLGITNGQLSIRSYYNNIAGVGVELKSNSINYSIKPIIYSLAWSKPGYEQIGDKITITGKGIANRPTVKFYDEAGKLISSAGATVKTINEATSYETIEVATPRKLNKVKVTVKVGSYESDQADALNYTARPILKSIQTGKSRRMSDGNIQVAAAKPGDTIKLVGQGFKSSTTTYVEFTGLQNKIVRALVPVENIKSNGIQLEVVVPKEAQSGQVTIEISGQKSNPIPLEIIPNIISVTPLIPSPGQEMTFWTNGVGLDIEQATVHFQLSTKEVVKVKPISLTESGSGDVIVKVLAPKAISNDSSTVKLQYGYWLNDQKYNLETSPVVERASMDLDSKILTIYGYGFSNILLENKINYKHADGTVVNPKAVIVGIKTSTEGQAIQIKISDNYYYGYISVTVDGKTSNEANIGPAVITRIERRVQFVSAENRVMGVLYISGRNFGPTGDVKAGSIWAKTHYRSNTFIIAVVEANQINNNPIVITKAK